MKFGAELARLKATLDSIPCFGVIHSFLQPVRVITKPILFIPSSRQNLPCAFISNNEGEDGEGEDDNDEQEHNEEVNPEEPCDSATGAD